MFIFYYYHHRTRGLPQRLSTPWPLVSALIDVSTQNLVNEKKSTQKYSIDKNDQNAQAVNI